MTLGQTRTALGRFMYAPMVVRVYLQDGSLFCSYSGSFDGIRIGPARELRLYFDLPHFLAWVGSPNGARLDLTRLSALRVGGEESDDEAIELWRDGRLVMEVGRLTPAHRCRNRGR